MLVVKDTKSSFDALRTAMKLDDTNLFVPLRVALVDLIGLGRRLEGRLGAKQELDALESRLPGFEIVAGVSAAEAANANAAAGGDLQKLLRGGGEVILRIWGAFGSSVDGVTIDRSLQPVQDAGEVKRLLQVLKSILEIFEFDDNLAATEGLGKVCQCLNLSASKMTSIVNQNSNITIVVGDGSVINNNWVINILQIVRAQKAIEIITAILGDHFVPEAIDDAQPSAAGCMPGTRARVLTECLEWAIANMQKIYWLAGVAGIGKSSIALTLCRMLRDEPGVLFGGGFFCSRSSGSITQTDVRCILPTLARLLSGKSPEFATALAAQLGRSARVVSKPIDEQIGPLLGMPLAALSPSHPPIVFVIDALDELSDEGELAQLLQLLADFQSDVPVKFILTSRPEMHIRRSTIIDREHSTILQLHTVDPEDVQNDIHTYIGRTLAESVKGSIWYTGSEVDTLVRLSNGLFIFASTALRYILDPEDDDGRSDRLVRVTSAVAQGSAATSPLDTMYELVITEASKSTTIDSTELERLKSNLACILTSRSPLTLQALADLTEVRPSRLRSSLRRLHAVVHLPVGDHVPGVHAVHVTFGDYLFGRASDHIRIPQLIGHQALARGCLFVMNNGLHFNISRSLSSYKENPSTKPDNISLALEYACVQWAHHIAAYVFGQSSSAASDPLAFDIEIGQKFRPKFLAWLEMLSILRKVGLGVGLLRVAGAAVTDREVSRFLSHAGYFLSSSHEAIARSAPHIYLSALPFADTSSLVYQDFSPHCNGLINVKKIGFGHYGGNAGMTLTGHSGAVCSVAYSSDGQLLASGSQDRTVRVWNTHTGEEALVTLYSDNGSVLSVDFARNNRWVASGTQKGTVCLWNVLLGRPTHRRLIGHSQDVKCVTFSPDSSRLASASSDQTARLWSTETGDQIAVLSGHTYAVNGVAFSPDGRILASVSSYRTICIWHGTTGQAVREPLKLPSRFDLFDPRIDVWDNKVDFAPNGEMIAATDYKNVALVQHTTGTQIASLSGDRKFRFSDGAGKSTYTKIHSAQFSRDSRFLVAAHGQGVRVWALQPNPGNASFVDFSGHIGEVNFATFSPNGQWIASASDDCTIRIWSTEHEKQAMKPSPVHISEVHSVAISLDGTVIVSGHKKKSVCVWNGRTGEAMLQQLTGDTSTGNSVAISPDGRLIASIQGWDILLWDAQSGEAVGEPLCGLAGDVNALEFSCDGRWIAATSFTSPVRLWDVTTRQTLVMDSMGDQPCAVAFSPHGGIIAAGGAMGRICFWKIDTGKHAHRSFYVDTMIRSLAISPDGTHIVCSAGIRTSPRIWNVSTGQPIFDLQGHKDTVWSVAWSLNGRFIGTGSGGCYDNTVRLWDPTTGTSLATLQGHNGAVRSVAFALNGQYIVSGSEDCTIRKWDVDAACQAAPERGDDPVAVFASATMDDGWLIGSAGELISWVPHEYRNNVQGGICTLRIDERRVVVTVGADGLRGGLNWTSCWKD